MSNIQLKAGDTAFVDSSRYSSVRVEKGEVVNVSPTGVVKVALPKHGGGTYNRSFMPNGRERVSGYDGATLITEAQYEDRKVLAERRKAIASANNQLQAIGTLAINAGNKAELIERLRAALAAVEAV